MKGDRDVLALLLDTPLPPLAAAAEVRSRGTRRRNRARAALAGGTVAVLLIAGGGTALLLSDNDQQTLVPATPTPTSAVPQPAVSTVPSPSGSAVTGPPSPAVTVTPGRAVSIPARALISASQLVGSWARDSSSRAPVRATVDACNQGWLQPADIVSYLSGSYSKRDPDGSVAPETPDFSQEVVRYASAAGAQAAAAQWRADVARCPQFPAGSTVAALAVVQATPSIVSITYAQDGQVLPPDYTGVVVSGTLVSTWFYGDPHGVRLADARSAAAQVQADLETAGG